MTQQLKRIRARRECRQGGFTLIELLVVIVILGVLSAVVVFAVRGVGDRGDSAAAAIDAKTLRTAQETFCAQRGEYATNQDELVEASLLSEGSSIHDTIGYDDGGPCRGSRFIITCDPTEATCGQNGTTPDGDFDSANSSGIWTRTGNLPVASTALTNIPMATMPNGKLLMWGSTTTSAGTTCFQLGDAECYSPPTTTTGPWSHGPVVVYDPATGTWAAAPNVPAPNPNWSPLTNNVEMFTLQGTPAECGLQCGKVFVQVTVGNSAKAIKVPPYYVNNEYFLFDPVEFDQGSPPWTRLPDANTVDNGFVTTQFARIAQINNCARTVTNDCGKVMVLAGGSDVNGRFETPPRSNVTNGPQNNLVALWDPLGPATPAAWSSTGSPIRRITQGTHAANSVILTSPTAPFTAADVGKLINGPGLSVTPSRIEEFIDASTIRIEFPTTGFASSTRIWNIGAGMVGGPNTASLPDGRLLMWPPGGSSSVYDPTTHTWAEPANHPRSITWTCPGNPTIQRHGSSQGNFSRTAVVLPDGRVMAAATGLGGACNAPETSLIFDPATNTWAPAPAVSNSLCGAGRTVQSSPGAVYGHRALVASAPCSAELNFTGSAWVAIPSTFAGNNFGVLADGRVVSAGGSGETWIYTPPLPNP